MEILFVIGNGFDLNLKMNTCYSDFYKYYDSIKSDKKKVLELKKTIKENTENWSDMELAFGKFTRNLETIKEFEEVYEDIVEKLEKFLREEEKKVDFKKIDGNKIYDYLGFPEQTLLPASQSKLATFKSKWNSQRWNVNIFTFNYTKSIEKFIGVNQKNLNIGTHHNSIPIVLKSVNHIHGDLDGTIIIGVNDLSQIENELFHKNEDILDRIIKNNCYQVLEHKIDDLFKTKIATANMICIFGSSLGESDKMWWELIGEQLKNDCELIIFVHDNFINDKNQTKLGAIKRKITTKFLSRTKLSGDDKEKIKNKINVGINRDMFKMIE